MTSSPSPSITVLRDEPLFGSAPYDAASDTFAYEAFAKALLDVFEHNPPPLSIGLFGPWGIGKSTIVNILFSKIRAESSSNLFPIYFNAWKYSGDSFRRQFLLDVASAVYGGRAHRKVQRLERLNYTDVLTEKPDGTWLSELKELLTANVIRTRRSGLIRIIAGLFLVAIGSAFSIHSSSAYPAITAVLAALVIFVLKMKFEDVFVIEDNRVFDPKLIFPEQFENEFRSLVDPDLLKGKRAVIVIDDIDRCDPSTIKDILISTKNFVGHANAYFLIPCDDLNVINIFDDPNHKAGYRDEMLRKYFNVGLRVPPISNRDLIDFANRMARDTKLPEEIVQLAVIADYRDARRIKNFANNFLLKLHIAKARSESGHLPALTPDRELQLAKLVIIEDCAPPIFARLVQNPGLLQLLESSALSLASDREELREYRLENWDTDYPGLKKALIGARYVVVSDVELLLSLKADNLELSVPSGAQFRAALLQGTHELLKNLLPEIAGRGSQLALADLLDDSLSRATGPLLANCISSTLGLPLRSFFAPNDTRRVARQLNEALLRDDQRVWLQSAPQIMDVVEFFDSQMAQKLFSKYVTELKTYVEQPGRFVETVNSIYPKTGDKASLIDMLNEKLVVWSGSESGLTAISAISQMKAGVGDRTFPSPQIVGTILDSFKPVSGEPKINELRKEIIFANWHPEYGEALGEVFLAVIQSEQLAGTFDPTLRFVLRALWEKPEIFSNLRGDQIASHLTSALSRTQNDEDTNLVRDCMITVAVVGLPGGKAIVDTSLSANWQNDSDQRIRRDLEIAQTLRAPDVASQIVASQTTMLSKEMQSPEERTNERIRFISEFEKLAPPSFLDDQIIASLSVSSETAFSFWEGIIRSRRDQFSQQTCLTLINKALDLVAASIKLDQRKPALLKLAIELSTSQPPTEQSAFTRKILELLWHPDDTIRDSAAGILSFLRSHSNQGDFRIYLNAGIHEHLQKVGVSSLSQFRPVIDALVANKDLWNETSSRSITQLAVTLSSDEALKPQALAILESVAEFDDADIQDVAHVLRNIESSQPDFSERARKVLQRLPAESGGSDAEGEAGI
jgi:hypothetical protein